MNANETTSAVNSGATSDTGRKSPEKTTESAPKKSGLTEAQYLAKQAEDAKIALAKTFADLKQSITHTGDVRLWTKQYPWIATATAVAAGVAAGYTLTPRNRDEAMEMWEQLKQNFTPAAAASPDDSAKEVKDTAPQSSVFGSILREALKVAAPLITTLISGAVKGNTTGSDNDHSNGSGQSPEPQSNP